MLPLFGAILALATISTAGLSAYYAVLKPALDNSMSDADKEAIIKEKDEVYKSWINCGLFNGIVGVGSYIVKTSQIKEVIIGDLKNSLNVIKFEKVSPSFKIGEIIHNVGLEDVKEIAIKNLGHNRIICKDITIYYVKERVMLESKVMKKKRYTYISDLHTAHEVSRDVIAFDYEDRILISEPEMENYQIHHISIDLSSDITVPILINITTKNVSYLFLTCSYKNVLNLSIIDDLSIIDGCVMNYGSVSALIEERDLSRTSSLPIQLRESVSSIITNTSPTRNGIKNIVKIVIGNRDFSDSINIKEFGVYGLNTTTNLITYTSFPLATPAVASLLLYPNTQENVAASRIFSLSSPTISSSLEIYQIKFITENSNNAPIEIYIDIYFSDVIYSRIETCANNNIVHLDLFTASSPGSTYTPPLVVKPTPLAVIDGEICNANMQVYGNAYKKVYEYELHMENPHPVTFTNIPIIDIEGLIPDNYGAPVTRLEVYTKKGTLNFSGFKIYYISSITNKIMTYSPPNYVFNPKGPGGGVSFNSYISGLIGSSTTFNTSSKTIQPLYICTTPLEEFYNSNNGIHVYRIEFTISSNAKFSQFYIKIITGSIEYVITSCVSNNIYYLDLNFYNPLIPKAICSYNDDQLYSIIKLDHIDYYSSYLPHTYNQLPITTTRTWNLHASELLNNIIPGNIRNPVFGLFLITINSDYSTLINYKVGVYYKLKQENIIKYKDLNRYLVHSVRSETINVQNKVATTGNVTIGKDYMLLCTDDILGNSDVYEIEIEMVNDDWGQNNIGLVDKYGHHYKNIFCARKCKLNIPIFGKRTDALITNLLDCSASKAGTAYANIDISKSVPNSGTNVSTIFYESCNPIQLTYGGLPSLVPSTISTSSGNYGFTNINSIIIANIGENPITIENQSFRIYATTAADERNSSRTCIFTESKGTSTDNTTLDVRLSLRTSYNITINRTNTDPPVLNMNQLNMHSITFKTIGKRPTQLEISLIGTYTTGATSVTKAYLYSLCVQDNNIILLNFSGGVGFNPPVV